MTPPERGTAARLIVTTAVLIDKQRRWPVDSRGFARAVDKLRATNAFAQQFQTFDGPVGRTCLDYDEVLRWAYLVGFTEYTETYNEWVPDVSERFSNGVLGKTPETLRDEVREVLEAFWEERS